MRYNLNYIKLIHKEEQVYSWLQETNDFNKTSYACPRPSLLGEIYWGKHSSVPSEKNQNLQKPQHETDTILIKSAKRVTV